jgi:hypothetical protein
MIQKVLEIAEKQRYKVLSYVLILSFACFFSKINLAYIDEPNFHRPIHLKNRVIGITEVGIALTGFTYAIAISVTLCYLTYTSSN